LVGEPDLVVGSAVLTLANGLNGDAPAIEFPVSGLAFNTSEISQVSSLRIAGMRKLPSSLANLPQPTVAYGAPAEQELTVPDRGHSLGGRRAE